MAYFLFQQSLSSQIVFSNESTFQVFDDKAQFFRRRPDEKLQKDFLVRRVGHPQSIIKDVWGCISGNGIGGRNDAPKPISASPGDKVAASAGRVVL